MNQKFSIIQSLLLWVETVNARFLPSGEATGDPTVLVVFHNSEVSPFTRTPSKAAPRTDELVINQLLPSADQVMPDRLAESPREIDRADPVCTSTSRIRSLTSSRPTMATVEPSRDRSHATEASGLAVSLNISLLLPWTGSKAVNTNLPVSL